MLESATDARSPAGPSPVEGEAWQAIVTATTAQAPRILPAYARLAAIAMAEKPNDKPPEDPPPPESEARAETPPGAPSDDSQEPHRKGRLEGFIPDILKRTFYAGLGAVFTTEEGIRKMASEFQLPKDVANYLVQQAGASKDELFRIMAKELRGFLESVNVSGELQKLLTSLSFEIKTEIRFVPNDEAIAGVKPDLKIAKVSIKKNEDKSS